MPVTAPVLAGSIGVTAGVDSAAAVQQRRLMDHRGAGRQLPEHQRKASASRMRDIRPAQPGLERELLKAYGIELEGGARKAAGLDSPATPQEPRRALGIDRELGTARSRRSPPPELHRVIAALPEMIHGARDRAWLLRCCFT